MDEKLIFAITEIREIARELAGARPVTDIHIQAATIVWREFRHDQPAAVPPPAETKPYPPALEKPVPAPSRPRHRLDDICEKPPEYLYIIPDDKSVRMTSPRYVDPRGLPTRNPLKAQVFKEKPPTEGDDRIATRTAEPAAVYVLVTSDGEEFYAETIIGGTVLTDRQMDMAARFIVFSEATRVCGLVNRHRHPEMAFSVQALGTDGELWSAHPVGTLAEQEHFAQVILTDRPPTEYVITYEPSALDPLNKPFFLDAEGRLTNAWGKARRWTAVDEALRVCEGALAPPEGYHMPRLMPTTRLDLEAAKT